MTSTTSSHNRTHKLKRRLELEATVGRCSHCRPHSHENQARSARGARPSKDRK